MTPRSTAAAATAALATSLLVAAGPAGPAGAADEAPPAVDAVSILSDTGGYPTLDWGFAGLAVTFSDSTPSDQHVYEVSMEPLVEGVETLTGVFEPYDGWSEHPDGSVSFPSEDVAIDVAYEVRVTETDAAGTALATSAAHPFTPSVVEHPEKARLKKRGPSRRKVYAGSRVRLRWTGAWGADAGLTQVVLARPRQQEKWSDKDFLFCEGTYCPPNGRSKALGEDPLPSFRVPARMAGRRLTIVSYGYGYERIDGARHGTRLPWGWRWDLRVVRKG